MKRSLLVLSAVALTSIGSASPAFAQASVLGSSFPIYAAAARGSALMWP